MGFRFWVLGFGFWVLGFGLSWSSLGKLGIHKALDSYAAQRVRGCASLVPCPSFPGPRSGASKSMARHSSLVPRHLSLDSSVIRNAMMSLRSGSV
ncbi:MAG: hypothetical protein FGM32_10100, partial [Candidatus Kapabacteria bacterium]|nr:hypothetical protein [Candidatus Kapabacteria bacterium]